MAGSDETFPTADVTRELNPAHNKNSFQVGSASSDIAMSIETKERDEVQKERERKEKMQSLKRGIIVSAVLVAVGGAAFAIFRKLREK
ncbi:hypothetical protein SLE2022_124450 [Rubroshorea leprosula]